jgi:hypothetical protein
VTVGGRWWGSKGVLTMHPNRVVASCKAQEPRKAARANPAHKALGGGEG